MKLTKQIPTFAGCKTAVVNFLISICKSSYNLAKWFFDKQNIALKFTWFEKNSN
jgi:hypothetical protein